MALVACPECNHQVSDSAFKCSQCGHQLRKAKRGVFGKLFKWSFILFNVLMAVWLFSSFGIMGEAMQTSQNEYEQAGAAIGSALGIGMIVTTWALGDIILGLLVLFTRPKEA
ncbi:hypothetical protein HNO53_20820 [Billgrantia antri]|uniref:Zinc ribbon domain-containing protein n=1 Tax=Halomonas sulfidivorans TaxID=2733488 RepID=A0ABX7WN25_9GAMM|nr:hypothetical protein HNO53_20820 [Halomonas sulfidivorans]